VGIRKFSINLLGAVPGIADDTAAVLAARFPSLRIAGTYAATSLPMTAEQEAYTIERIRKARPDMLFVALGPQYRSAGFART
jgi:N-acetylglucosaminyldiphosphoundecaprenol N-acetyl-beta-D-mannosaminyltransferase